ncbi:MAG: hypothetical protein ACYCOO_05640 [Chitinophagaceae bacterium]
MNRKTHDTLFGKNIECNLCFNKRDYGSGGRTIEQKKSGDDLYNAFSKGLPRYFDDERSKGVGQAIRAMPDGSEDLVDFDWRIRKGNFY